MKLLIIDAGGMGLDFALRCKWAGHSVKLFLGPVKHGDVGKGLVDRVGDWELWMGWADLILLTDCSKYRLALDPYFRRGLPIFGTNMEMAEWELDRVCGQTVFKAAGIETLPFHEFTSYEEAEAFVRKNPARYVCKPNDSDVAFSYLSEGPADMLYMLQRWAKKGRSKKPFILQKFQEGIEFGVGGWFGPSGWVGGAWEENFEHKKLMNGNLGVNTGEMGTCIKYSERSLLAEKLLCPLEPMLRAMNFVGDIDVSAIIDKKDQPWPLEFTVRLGWPSFHILTSLHRGDPCEWILDLVQGKDTLKVRTDHALGVVVAIPDFPHSHLTGKEVTGVPIYGVNEGNIADVHLVEVMAGCAPCGEDMAEKELFVSAGDNLLCCVGRGGSVKESQERAYKLVKGIEIPNSPMYRTDIGDRLEGQLKELHALGYAKEWRWT